jgi:hypothetical protein
MAKFGSIKEAIKTNWKPILWGLAPFIIIVIVFALPLKDVAVQVTESYVETEMRQEPYTVSETGTVTEPYTETETKTETVFDSNVNSNNWAYTFDVKKPNTNVSVNVYGYSSPGTQYYFGPDYSRMFFPFNYYSSSIGRASITVSYPEQITKTRVVTKTVDVVKYRQLPVQVNKERKITRHVKMPLWGYIFYNQPE